MATLRRLRAYLHTYRYLLLLPPMLAYCLLQCTAAQSQPQPVGEAELLLQMKRAWGDPPVLAAWNWSAATSAPGAHCRWPYVSCDSAGHVTSLVLTSISLTGPVPDAVGGLSSLQHLDLSNNRIAGVFPTALYRCRSLQYLDLSGNYLEGELPHDIGQGLGTNLSTLVLGFNRFNGSIPIALGGLTSLRMLWLEENPFDPGELPASFMNLTHLVSLYARSCNLVGAFPSYLTKMMLLEELSLGYNSLIGAIPLEIRGLKNLQVLDLSANNFSGEIPMSIGQLRSLESLFLYNNMLTGELPPELGKHAPGLAYVRLEDNDLTGRIPEGICAGGQLRVLATCK